MEKEPVKIIGVDDIWDNIRDYVNFKDIYATPPPAQKTINERYPMKTNKNKKQLGNSSSLCSERISDIRELELEGYRNNLRGLMPQIRSYYSKIADDEKLMEMLVRDSCFIMELILEYQYEIDDNPILRNRQLLALLQSDMLLLRNQIPYAVLETLFSSIEPPGGCCSSLDHLALSFFANYLLTPECCNRWSSADKQQGGKYYYNLLHLYHSCATALTPRWGQPPDNPFLMPGATDLAEAGGIRFKRRIDDDDGSFFNIFFRKGGIMEFSPLLLTNRTITLYRNLIAFEQLYYPKVEAPVTTYFMALGCLVRTEEDLELLRRMEIIGCATTEEKAYQFFKEVNKLNNNTSGYNSSSSCIREQQLSAEVNNFVGVTRRRRIAAIKFGFFSLVLADLMLAFSVLARFKSVAAHKAVLFGLVPFQMLASFFTAKNDRKGRYANVILLHCTLFACIALSYCNVL